MKLLVWPAFHGRQHEHAVHHATAGYLDRRGIRDVTTLTAEHRALSRWRRSGYPLFRNTVAMLGTGRLLVLLLKPR